MSTLRRYTWALFCGTTREQLDEYQWRLRSEWAPGGGTKQNTLGFANAGNYRPTEMVAVLLLFFLSPTCGSIPILRIWLAYSVNAERGCCDGPGCDGCAISFQFQQDHLWRYERIFKTQMVVELSSGRIKTLSNKY